MTYAQVLALIQQWIVANGNNEITANVLRPILVAMLSQPNDLIGDLDNLQTGDKSNLVAAINEILSSNISPSTALRGLDTTGVDFDQSELYWVRDAINQTIANTGDITANVGQMIVFFADVLLSDGSGMAVIQRRYYRLTTGANTVTTIPTNIKPPLMPDGSGLVFLDFTDTDIVVDLGSIGAADVWDAFNSDGEQPFAMNDDKFVVAIQGGTQKVWKWVGGDGDFGNSATPAVATDFVDLTDVANNPPPAQIDYLPTKTITTTPYNIESEDLNRPLIFTSNDQVVNVSGALVGEAIDNGLTLFDFKAHFTGTGTHTVNYPDGNVWTGDEGALVYALCIDTTGDTVWIVKEYGGGGGGAVDSVNGQTGVVVLDEEDIIGTAIEDDDVGGTYDLDLATFSDALLNLTSNTTITVSNLPSAGESFVKTFEITSDGGTETLDLPGTWVIIGEYDPAEINYLTIKFSNYTTAGAKVLAEITQ